MNLTGCKILILDDNYDIRTNLQYFLEDEGFLCSAFSDSLSALEFIKHNDIHAGVIDLRMPVMNGEEFILEAIYYQPNMKFLIYTGSTDYRLSEELKKIGMTQQNVCYKPVKSMEIISCRIEYILGRKKIVQ